jgi:hypothetical protein
MCRRFLAQGRAVEIVGEVGLDDRWGHGRAHGEGVEDHSSSCRKTGIGMYSVVKRLMGAWTSLFHARSSHWVTSRLLLSFQSHNSNPVPMLAQIVSVQSKTVVRRLRRKNKSSHYNKGKNTAVVVQWKVAQIQPRSDQQPQSIGVRRKAMGKQPHVPDAGGETPVAPSFRVG